MRDKIHVINPEQLGVTACCHYIQPTEEYHTILRNRLALEEHMLRPYVEAIYIASIYGSPYRNIGIE